MTAIALTIAGSDSSGGAGIQADLKTFAFQRIHGASVLTCVTAQNTCGVTRVDALPLEAITAQLEAVVTDLAVGAVKTGMLLNGEIISLVAKKLVSFGLQPLVVDPVMVSRTGAKLIDDGAIAQMQHRLLPLATLLTPNRYEAQILAQRTIDNLDDMKQAAVAIHAQGCGSVLVKGGAMPAPYGGIDVLFDGDRLEVLETAYITTPHTHGTGCTLSAVITANLAKGSTLWDAVVHGKAYVTEALRHSLAIGRGRGPVGHFFPLR
ncbi:MAG: bifunctional hydroxymethylpyrimidine kinase/phosphomethylpyrimidine kinase [Oscillatoriales cyanobacterium SM2_2_1]|nr:bifunctional hydroxymethylpyrimidine kinase/phosphomethylpyrimidine kinase [Oscillatoriales cyanobacterium SM2_2_1]